VLGLGVVKKNNEKGHASKCSIGYV